MLLLGVASFGADQNFMNVDVMRPGRRYLLQTQAGISDPRVPDINGFLPKLSRWYESFVNHTQRAWQKNTSKIGQVASYISSALHDLNVALDTLTR
jgi:hypothetical protein